MTSTEPRREQQSAFAVAGLTVRTTNQAEHDAATARIGALWGRFYAEDARAHQPHADAADPRIYGVYSAYASDAHGAFDLTAGVAVTGGDAVRIAAGTYLVFDAHGPMPQAILAGWQRVWDWFGAHPEVRRSYRSDFEAYDGAKGGAIHIGVEA